MTQIEGFKELSAQLSAIGASVGGKALRSAVMSASLPALRAAQNAVPVGTRGHKTYKGRFVAPGFAKRNINRSSYLSRDKTKAGVRIGPIREAFYVTQFLEIGTSKIPRRPWLEPAFRSSVPAMLSRLRERLSQLIEKAAKKK